MNIRDLIVIVVAVEFGLHYFQWRQVLGMELPRLAAYVLGLLGMMVPLSIWLMDRNETEVVQTLWIAIVAAGMTVFALYGFDHYVAVVQERKEALERERLASSMLKDKVNEQGK